MKAGTGWLSVAERGSLLGMYFIVGCYRIFGRRICSYLIVPVVGYFFLTGRRARRASRQYLERLHRWSARQGSGGASRAPGLLDSFRHFHQFALTIIDRLSFFLGDTDQFATIVHGREHLERLAQAGRGTLVLSAHLGSFDALRLVADAGGVPLNVAMFLNNARMINAVFTRLNPARPLRIIDLARGTPRSVFDIRACIQRGEFVGMLGDRVGMGDDTRISWVPFLGERAAIPHGPFLLASALKCPVLLMIGLRRDPATYEVFVEVLAEQVELPAEDRTAALDALARRYVARLEHYCLRAPYQWFNFYEFWGDLSPERDMTGPSYPGIEEVLPQTGRMVLLTRIVGHSQERTTCAVEISTTSPFYDGQGGVPAWVALEYMAQCVAAHGGLRARAAGDPVTIGFLLGSRSVALHTAGFRPGQELEVEAAHLWGEHDFFSFTCTVRDARTRVTLAEATLAVARAAGVEAVLPKVGVTGRGRAEAP